MRAENVCACAYMHRFNVYAGYLCSSVTGSAPSSTCIVMLMQSYKLKQDLSGFIEFNDLQLHMRCSLMSGWCVIDEGEKKEKLKKYTMHHFFL